jgi:hypothetical protein
MPALLLRYLVDAYQAVVGFFPRRTNIPPSKLKPVSIIAQVEGSGTDDPRKSIDHHHCRNCLR